MLAYLCPNCGNKFQSEKNLIDVACYNVDFLGNICRTPLQPIISMLIENIQEDQNSDDSISDEFDSFSSSI